MTTTGYTYLLISARVGSDPPFPKSPIAVHSSGVRLNGANPSHPDVFAWLTAAEARQLARELLEAARTV